jgi:predicted membrane protein
MSQNFTTLFVLLATIYLYIYTLRDDKEIEIEKVNENNNALAHTQRFAHKLESHFQCFSWDSFNWTHKERKIGIKLRKSEREEY